MSTLTLALALCAAVQEPEIPAQAAILESLRPGHPRLIVLQPDVERTKELIATNNDANRMYGRLQRRAHELLTTEPIVHELVGPRLLTQSRRCVDRVYTLATIYRLSGDRQFADRAIREMLTAAAFPDWNPSHFLDTAEMTHALAIGYDWLYDELSAADRGTIRQAIVEKGLREAEKIYREKRWWARATHNWNQVCNGGIGLGALAVANEQPELAAYVLHEALQSVCLPMRRFAPDGAWDEGPGYWDYATRYNVYLLAGLESALGSDFGLSRFPGFANTGDFRVHFTGPLRRTFNFADGSDKSGASEQMFWLARKFDKPLYAWHQRQFLDSASALDLWWFDPRGDGPGDEPFDRWFREVDVVTMRSAWDDPHAIFVGFKGGDNRANHSHLELGTFVLDANGQRWAVDLGPDDYNLPGYFGNKRWTYYRLATEGQNTLTFDGKNQNPKAVAPIRTFASTVPSALAVADLSQAYDKQATRVWRGIALLDRRQVLVQDEIDGAGDREVAWSMHTTANIKIDGNKADLKQGGESLRALILEPRDATFEVVAVNPPSPQRPTPGVQKLMVRTRVTHARTLRLAVLLTPAIPVESPRPELRPLADWR